MFKNLDKQPTKHKRHLETLHSKHVKKFWKFFVAFNKFFTCFSFSLHIKIQKGARCWERIHSTLAIQIVEIVLDFCHKCSAFCWISSPVVVCSHMGMTLSHKNNGVKSQSHRATHLVELIHFFLNHSHKEKSLFAETFPFDGFNRRMTCGIQIHF